MEQVIGRASRFCSHKDLDEEDRKVNVYIYIAYHSSNKQTVDEYIKDLAETKSVLVKQFEKAIKEAAIDCKININANTDDINEIKCDS